MAWNDPSAIDGLALSALEWRRLQSGLLAHDTDAVSARPGVLHGLGVSIVTLTVTVAAGSAVVTPSVGSNGSYIGVNDAGATLTATAQDATYARIDRVVLRCYDNAVDGSGQAKLVAEIITGTPAAAPVAPTLPAGRLEIAQLSVPKSGAGSITVVDKRTWTAPVGGPIQVATVADLPSGSFLRPGIVAVIGTGADYAEYSFDGTVWRRRAASGRLYNPGDVALSAGTARADLPADISFVGMTSATGRLTVVTPGIYIITASATIYSTTVNAGDYAEVRLNGVGVPGGGLGIVAGTDAMYKTGRAALILMLAAGDYLELWRGGGGAGLVTQKSGSLAVVRIG